MSVILNECMNCHKVIDADRTFCSQTCYAIWQIETEGDTKLQPINSVTKPEIRKTNSLLATVNNEFN